MIDILSYIQTTKAHRQAHLRLEEPCQEFGGDSREFRGLLAFVLGTTIPKGNKIHLCHACHNPKCGFFKHLYWGTAKENMDDSNVREKGANATRGKPGKAPWNKGLRKINRTGDAGTASNAD